MKKILLAAGLMAAMAVPNVSAADFELKWAFSNVYDSANTGIYSYETEALKKVSDVVKINFKCVKTDTGETPVNNEDFTGGISAIVWDDNKYADVKVTCDDQPVEGGIVVGGLITGNLFTLRISYMDPVATPGSYSVSIPEGLVTIGGVVAPAQELKDIFTISADAPKKEFMEGTVIYPTDPVYDLSDIIVAFPETLKSCEGVVASLKLEDGGDGVFKPISNVEFADMGTFKQIRFTFYEYDEQSQRAPVTTPGKYTFYMGPEQVCAENNENLFNSAVSATFTVVEKPVVKDLFADYVVTPAEGEKVASLSQVSVYFPNCGDNLAEGDELWATTLVNKTTGQTYHYPWTRVESNNTAVIDFAMGGAPITENGVYEVTIPANALTIYPEFTLESPAISWTFEIDQTVGVNAVDGEDATFTVVDVCGRTVLENADKAAVEKLGNGLYIINGKKVLKH